MTGPNSHQSFLKCYLLGDVLFNIKTRLLIKHTLAILSRSDVSFRNMSYTVVRDGQGASCSVCRDSRKIARSAVISVRNKSTYFAPKQTFKNK